MFDFDHDAGDYAKDGGDYMRCLDYLEFIGADGINVRIHSANPAAVKRMKQAIAKNQWNEVFDIVDDGYAAQHSMLDENEFFKSKLSIVPDDIKKFVDVKLFNRFLEFLDKGGFEAGHKLFGKITDSQFDEW